MNLDDTLLALKLLRANSAVKSVQEYPDRYTDDEKKKIIEHHKKLTDGN